MDSSGGPDLLRCCRNRGGVVTCKSAPRATLRLQVSVIVCAAVFDLRQIWYLACSAVLIAGFPGVVFL